MYIIGFRGYIGNILGIQGIYWDSGDILEFRGYI
jgi:hypothetical protein